MKPIHRLTLTLTSLALLASFGAKAHAAPAARAGEFQHELDAYLADAQEKLVSLEDAIPQATFTWRPAPGVRSTAEVFMHVAYANYRITAMATGKEPPASAGWVPDRGKWDTKTTDKAEIKKILEASFAHMREALKTLPDAELEKKVTFFGREVTRRAALLQLLAHANEHLGQAVAYARTNKIAPPWSKPEK